MQEIRLCLTGELRSGKSTLADYAEDVHYMIPFAFGDELKADFHKAYPHVAAHPKPRKGYQLFGQLKRQVYGQDFWLDKCFAEIERVRQSAISYNTVVPSIGHEVKPPVVETMFMPIITDARQPNEFAACRNEGFVVIKVVSSYELRMQRAHDAGDDFNEADLLHETERYIADTEADYTIVNDGSVKELYAQFDTILLELLLKKASA